MNVNLSTAMSNVEIFDMVIDINKIIPAVLHRVVVFQINATNAAFA